MIDQPETLRPRWWAQNKPDSAAEPVRLRAIAYYRHSAQDRQENSVAIQQEQVRQWAATNGVEIIHEFADRGKSGLTAEGRDAFNDMMENWVKVRSDFHYVLCLDVSRWGRFQDIDLSATYSAECKRHGKLVIYTTLGKPKDNDQLHQVYVQFERFRAAQYSKELSDKVLRGCIKIAQQGYWAGGKPPYGLSRMLLSESRQPVQRLAPGQRKSIQNQRVTLARGDELQVAIVQRVFREFTEIGLSTLQISNGLNLDRISPPGRGFWNRSKVKRILVNELYVGTLVYNRTTQKLKTPTRYNSRADWVRTQGAFEPIVPPEAFEKAQTVFDDVARRYTPSYMIEQLARVVAEKEFVRPSLLRHDHYAASAGRYAREFSSLDAAYQQVFGTTLSQVRSEVEGLLRGSVEQVERYDDFLVVNRKFTVLVQPSVPVPFGYDQYWYFRPDRRVQVDITLGVPVSGPDSGKILGYLVLPRLLVRARGIRLFGSSESRLDFYGHQGLDILFELART